MHQPFAALNRALAKEKLWAAEQHSFVRTLDMLDEAVLELLPDGRIASANSGWWHLTGNVPGAGPLAEAIHADDRNAFLKCLGNLQEGRKDEFHGRFRIMAEAAYEQWMGMPASSPNATSKANWLASAAYCVTSPRPICRNVTSPTWPCTTR